MASGCANSVVFEQYGQSRLEARSPTDWLPANDAFEPTSALGYQG